MRAFFVILLMSLSGCLGTQSSHNPLKKTKAKGVAPVSAPASIPPAPMPELDRASLMKEMFLVQRDLNHQILKMAEALSEIELMEFNEWLAQYGRQLRLKHPAPKQDRRVY